MGCIYEVLYIYAQSATPAPKVLYQEFPLSHFQANGKGLPVKAPPSSTSGAVEYARVQGLAQKHLDLYRSHTHREFTGKYSNAIIQ